MAVAGRVYHGENCEYGENSENGLNLWLGCGVCTSVKIMKMLKMLWACGWGVGCVPKQAPPFLNFFNFH